MAVQRSKRLRRKFRLYNCNSNNVVIDSVVIETEPITKSELTKLIKRKLKAFPNSFVEMVSG